eukprot:6203880-Pleurochrysis_carterae.AAC.2
MDVGRGHQNARIECACARSLWRHQSVAYRMRKVAWLDQRPSISYDPNRRDCSRCLTIRPLCASAQLAATQLRAPVFVGSLFCAFGQIELLSAAAMG